MSRSISWITGLVSLGLLVASISGQSCPNHPDIRTNGASCYFFLTAQPDPLYNQQEARSYCQNSVSGGSFDLLKIDSQAEQAYIKQIIMDGFIDFERSYLGVQETVVQEQDTYKWLMDGTQVSKGYPMFCAPAPGRVVGGAYPTTAPATMEACRQNCRGETPPFTYAAMRPFDTAQSIGECYCFNDDISSTAVDNAQCHWACPGDPTERCGGATAATVSGLESSWGATGGGFTDWLLYEPRALGGDCVVLKGTHWGDYNWGAEQCYERNPFICQFPTPQVQCVAAGHKWSSSSSRCYQLYAQEENMIGARIHCQSMGGDLVKVDTAAFNSELINAADDIDTAAGVERDWFIGLSMVSWADVDGRPLSYESFANRQPESRNRNCAVISRNAGGGNLYNWEDSDCAIARNVICEYELPIPITTTTTTTTTTPPPTTTTTPTTTTPTTTTPTTTTTTTELPTTTTSTTTTTTTTQRPTTTTTRAAVQTQTLPTQGPTTRAPVTPGGGGATTTRGPSIATTWPSVFTTPTSTSGSATTVESGGSVSGQDELNITIGVAVAIGVVCLAVLVVFIRLMVYCCCQRKSGYGDQNRLNVESGEKKSDLNFQNRGYEEENSYNQQNSPETFDYQPPSENASTAGLMENDNAAPY